MLATCQLCHRSLTYCAAVVFEPCRQWNGKTKYDIPHCFPKPVVNCCCLLLHHCCCCCCCCWVRMRPCAMLDHPVRTPTPTMRKRVHCTDRGLPRMWQNYTMLDRQHRRCPWCLPMHACQEENAKNWNQLIKTRPANWHAELEKTPL